jgi:alkylated DNA repair dioxygenase AlkB
VLSKLVAQINEEHGRPTIKVFGKDHLEPRLKAYFSASNDPSKKYVYSNAAQTSHGWPDVVRELSELGSRLVPGHSFPRALVNYYRSGGDSVGKHRDSDAMKGYILSFTCYPPSSAAASSSSSSSSSTSLASWLSKASADDNEAATTIRKRKTTASAAPQPYERQFVISTNKPHKRVATYMLGQGSLLLMAPSMQSSYVHELTKTTKVKTGRVNITLREEQS